MNLALRMLEAIFLVILIVLLSALGWWGHQNAPLIHDALWNFAASTYDVKAHSKQELETTQKVLADTKQLIGETSCSLNGCPGLFGRKAIAGLLPQMTLLVQKAQPIAENLTSVTAHLDLAVQHVDGAIQNLNALLQGATATTEELQAAIKRVNDVVRDLDDQVTDPDIKKIIANLKEVTANAAKGMAELAAITTDGRQIADKARETYMKPVNLWWGLVKELLPLAGSAAQVVK